MRVAVPTPARRPEGVPDGLAALAADLAATVDGEVRFDVGSRALYSIAGSNYRQVPLGVVVPRSVEDVVGAMEVCRRHAMPVLGAAVMAAAGQTNRIGRGPLGPGRIGARAGGDGDGHAE